MQQLENFTPATPIVECSYVSTTESFVPERVRSDKTHPNGMKTVEKTLLNIIEDIRLSELINLAENI